MYKVLIVPKEPTEAARLDAELSQEGFACIVVQANNDVLNHIAKQDVDVVLLDSTKFSDSKWTESNRAQLREIKQEKRLAIIALVSSDKLHDIGSALDIDDFVVEPYHSLELSTRIKRLVGRTKRISHGKIIRCGDLVIDIDRYEVYLEGRELSLTFKEYELLKFLAANKGKVFSRDTLLNEVWGYDYYGGDRTVDVHIRRLRSKIEDLNHTFIDTVRNIGYKFREES